MMIVILAAISVNFLLIHTAPGDPTYMMLGRHAREEDRARVREELGLDRPMAVQYLNYIGNMLRGNLGTSYRFQQPVLSTILQRLPATLLLTIPAFLISMILGVILGVVTATRPGSMFDVVTSIGGVAGFSIPVFWTSILLILVFSLRLGWFPVQGMTNVRESYTGLAHVVDVLHHLVLPIIALVIQGTGSYIRLMRSSMLEVLGSDYIRVAQAKGVDYLRVVFRHAAPNASLAVITLAGARMGYLFTMGLMVEIVFAWPGTGRLLYDAVLARDYPLLLGCFFVIALLVSSANLLADISYAVSDPRIRLT
jgi:peptide/nickel transport system permease protein